MRVLEVAWNWVRCVRRARGLFVGVGVALLPLPAARAGEGDGKAEIAEAIRELGASSLQTRKRARQALVEAGWDAREELAAVAGDPNPEVAVAAREILAEMLPWVTRSTPLAHRNLVERYARERDEYSVSGCVSGLLARRPVPVGVFVALLEWDRDDARRRFLVRELVAMHPGYLLCLLERGDTQPYERFLQWAARMEMAELVPYIVGYAHHRNRLEELYGHAASLVATNPSPFSRRLLAEVQTQRGKESQAAELAGEIEDWEFVERFLTRTGKWRELARELTERPGELTGPELFYLAGAQRLAGRNRQAAQTLARIVARCGPGEAGLPDGHDDALHYAGDIGAGGGELWIDYQSRPVDATRWLFDGLRFKPQKREWHGPIPRALPGARPEDTRPRRHAYMTPGMGVDNLASHSFFACLPSADEPWRQLLAYGFTADAMRALSQIDGGLVAVADLLVLQRRYEDADRVLLGCIAKAKQPEAWLLEVRRAGLLYQLGDDRGAELVRQIVARFQTGEAELGGLNGVGVFVSAMQRGGLGSLLPEVLPELIGSAEGDGAKLGSSLVSSLFPPSLARRVASFWWSRLTEAYPEESVSARLVLLQRFLAGETGATERDAILRLGMPHGGLPGERARNLSEMALTYAHLGMDQDAANAYRQIAECSEADPNDMGLADTAWITCGYLYASRGGWRQLADAAGRSVAAGRPEHLVDQAVFLFWAGEEGTARKLMDRAVAMTRCSRRPWVGYPFAGWEAEDILSGIVPFPVALRETESAGYPATELRRAQCRWLESLRLPRTCFPYKLFAANADLAGAECRALIEAGDCEGALGRAIRVSDAFPGDMAGAARTVAALQEAGAREQADVLAAHVIGREKRFLLRWPKAIPHLAAVARFAATTGRELAWGEVCARDAMRRSARPTELSGDLAVILYRRGDLDGAIAAMRESVQVTPYSMPNVRRLGVLMAERRKRDAVPGR